MTICQFHGVVCKISESAQNGVSQEKKHPCDSILDAHCPVLYALGMAKCTDSIITTLCPICVVNPSSAIKCQATEK